MQTSRLAILVPLYLLVALAALAVLKLYLPAPTMLEECARDPRMKHAVEFVSRLIEDEQYDRAELFTVKRCKALWRMDGRE